MVEMLENILKARKMYLQEKSKEIKELFRIPMFKHTKKIMEVSA